MFWKELKLREYDNIIDNAEDKEHFIKKDEADIKKSYEILNRNLEKLGKHIEEMGEWESGER